MGSHKNIFQGRPPLPCVRPVRTFLVAVSLHRQLQSGHFVAEHKAEAACLKNVFVASHGLPNPIFWEDLALENLS